MDPIDIRLIIGKKPEQIIDYLIRKGYKISFSWQDVWKEAHAKAFTVAKAMKLDILSDIRNELQKAMDQGLSFNQFQENLKPILKAKGWWGKVKAKDIPRDVPLPANVDPEKEVLLGSPWRLRTIYRVNLDTAYAAGHYKNMIKNSRNRPYWMYSAVLDENTRPTHRALNGKVFRADDPIWDKIYPPNDWNCRCTVVPLTQKDLDELNLKVSKGEESIVEKLKPGKGWDYNPGKAFLEFDTNFGNFTQVSNQKTYKDYGRPSVRDIPDEYFINAPNKMPTIKEVGEENFINLIKKEFDLVDKDYSIVKTADNDNAIFTLNRLKHIWVKKDGREQFATFIKPTLQNPYEIYLSEYESTKGFIEYRKVYIGLFKDEKRRSFFVALRMEKDSTIFVNAFPKNLSELDKLRRGILIYNKK